MTKQTLTNEEAAAALETMTPEAYTELMAYVASMEEALPEAPASCNFKVATPRGWDIQFTLRGWDENRLLERVSAFERLLEEAGCAPAGGKGPATPQAAAQAEQKPIRITSDGVDPAVVEGPEVDSFKVETLTYGFSGKTPHLVVRGGRWTQFGWKAWPEVIPGDVDYGKWPVGEPQSPPDCMAFAYVDKGKKKIVAFATV